jgi:NitT/TauT family transport system ATP-binding protein
LVWREVSHGFRGVPVLDRVTLDVSVGETVALVGPAGCGKSVLLAMAGQFLTPDSGLVRNRFRRTACLFREPQLMPWRSVLDSVAESLRRNQMPRAARYCRSLDLLCAVGLADEAANKRPSDLSCAECQQAALARALAGDPDLLLLDDPFGGLQGEPLCALLDLAGQTIAARNLTALLTTQDLAQAERLADRIVMMSPRPGRPIHPNLHECPASFSNNVN